jgi:hypothetical protein
MSVLEARFQRVEEQQATAEEQAETLVDAGLARINEVLLPEVTKIQKLTSLGFLTARSSSSAKLEIGQKTFVVDDGDQRDLFTPSAFVTIERAADFNTWSIGLVLSYDSSTGALIVSLLSATGDGLPHADWVISCSAGASLAATAAANNAGNAAALATAKAQATAADAVQTAIDRAAAAASRAAADASRDAAAASAAAAQTWDPTKYMPLAGGVFTSVFAYQNTYTGAASTFAGAGGGLQVRSATADGLSAAMMAFHRPSALAVWFGLDVDGEFVRAGWSDGANRYKFWTEKNFNANLAVSVGSVQTFTPAQKKQAKQNIGAGGVTSAVAATKSLAASDINTRINISGNAYTINLPAQTSWVGGDYIEFTNAGVGTITIARNASDTAAIAYNGISSANISAGPGQSLRLTYDSANWTVSGRAAPPERSPSIDVDQSSTFTQAQKMRAKTNIGAGGAVIKITASTFLDVTAYEKPIWVISGSLTITLPPIASSVSGDYIEIVNYSSDTAQLAASRGNSEASLIISKGNALASMLLGPWQSVRLYSDGGNWVAGFNTSALGSTTFFSVAAKIADINSQAVIAVAAVDFLATGSSVNVWGDVWYNHSSTTGVNMYSYVDIVDKALGQVVSGGMTMINFLVAGYSPIEAVSNHLSYGSLTVGKTYTARLLVQRSAAAGPTEVNPAVGGMCI